MSLHIQNLSSAETLKCQDKRLSSTSQTKYKENNVKISNVASERREKDDVVKASWRVKYFA